MSIVHHKVTKAKARNNKKMPPLIDPNAPLMMANLPFNHDRYSYIVRLRREGGTTIAELFSTDGTSTNFKVDATDDVLSDMKAKGHHDPLHRLQEEARDAFISRTRARG